MAVKEYWDLVGPVWEHVDIYNGEETFLKTFRQCPKEVGHLYATHFCQSEVCNGGFWQFFENGTGMLAPEAIEGFKAIGLPAVALVLKEAINLFPKPYSRDQTDRTDWMYVTLDDKASAHLSDELDELTERFYELLQAEEGGFTEVADSYARSVGDARQAG